eukprot:gnl/MRDRNA2_/MRDRNA2_146949_c0_seq1.p1 gnl/MRDRNA2_/MRDRNA2_146949_c0~~gnl/MRDRNA2_/MRDRNA2_146949_c0_seq1.p1  ORF type:complete len:605 (+),score=87.52 gnl/MRDRNA2_/MRDRNA2_146949_c0_seq1:71-1816(+)
MVGSCTHNTMFLLMMLGHRIKSVAGFGQNAKLLAHVCVQYSTKEMDKAIQQDTIMWALLSKDKNSCEPVEPGFTLVLNSFEQQPGISKCVDFPVYQQTGKSSAFFEGKYWAFCTHPKGKVYSSDKAVFVNSRVSPWLPNSGILHLQLNVGGQIWFQVQPFQKMDIIPALSFCNPAQIKDEKVVNSRNVVVYGHRDGTTKSSIPPGKEPECGGQVLMAVPSNECSFRELEDYYVEPPGAPFLITVADADGKCSNAHTIALTKDAHTLFYFEYGGNGLISSSWRIYEDQSYILSQCAAVCPSLKSAMTSYPEATIDFFLPETIPAEAEMMSTACSIRYCLLQEVACSALTMHWPALDIPIRNLECPCACKSSFTEPECLHVDVCAAGDCKDHVQSVWACAKTQKDGACRGVVSQFSNSPKVLECVEGKDLSQIDLSSDEGEAIQSKGDDEDEDDEKVIDKDRNKNKDQDKDDDEDSDTEAEDADKDTGDDGVKDADVDAAGSSDSNDTQDTKLFSLSDMFKATKALASSAPHVRRTGGHSLVPVLAGSTMVFCALSLVGFSLLTRLARRREPISEDFANRAIE